MAFPKLVEITLDSPTANDFMWVVKAATLLREVSAGTKIIEKGGDKFCAVNAAQILEALSDAHSIAPMQRASRPIDLDEMDWLHFISNTHRAWKVLWGDPADYTEEETQIGLARRDTLRRMAYIFRCIAGGAQISISPEELLKWEEVLCGLSSYGRGRSEAEFEAEIEDDD